MLVANLDFCAFTKDLVWLDDADGHAHEWYWALSSAGFADEHVAAFAVGK